MEPALQGRDDRHDPGPAVVRGCAAMEPALQGRDDVVPSTVVRPFCTLPQWSPPFRGGMTNSYWLDLARSELPQWSPPFRGGMTSPPLGARHVPIHAAMEPALQGRDDDRSRRRGLRSDAHAAMEPALQGRDDSHLPNVADVRTAAAMEPALQGRDDGGFVANPMVSSPAAMEPALQGRDDRAPAA